MDDPRRLLEQERRKHGLPRMLQITRTPHPHPRVGGSRGYSVPMRGNQLWSYQNGFPLTASRRLIMRWAQRLHPYLSTGNRARNKIMGLEQYLMILFLLAWPDVRIDEIIAFIANAGPGRIYSRAQVTRRMRELGLTKKVGSTEAKQGSFPVNMFKRKAFWTNAPPFGVNGCERRKLIDFDECGIELQRSNRKYGHCYSGIRVVKPGHYSKDTKLIIILAIEAGDPALEPGVQGSIENLRRWLRILIKVRTTTLDFNNFLTYVCNNLETAQPQGVVGNTSRIFLWDNLSSHCSPIIHQTVEGQFGHTIIRRPPYKPADAPIEYIFCQLMHELQSRTYDCNNLVELIQQI